MARYYEHKGGDVSGIGIHSDDLAREFHKVIGELQRFGHKLDAKEIGKISRRSLVVTRDKMRENIDNLDKGEFKVYRNGGLYAEIKPGQLKKSIGIRKSQTRNSMTASAYWVGPVVKGAFKDPEKGGWFAHFLNYGGLVGGSKGWGAGTYYKGRNYGFADRAKAQTIGQVVAYFTHEVRLYIEKTFNRVLS